MIPACLPWHHRQWQRIEHTIRVGRVPHALLLHGAAGNGKAQFAARLAAMLLCPSRDPPCAECESCRLSAAGSHPDRIEVTVAPDRREIVIDQIRSLIHSVGLTARFGRYKVVVIEPAEQMNQHAANTLLKTLEEPAGATIFLLVSSHNARLLATIRSRCRLINFPTAEPTIAIEWLRGKVSDPETALAVVHGAPLRVIEWSDRGLFEARAGLEHDIDGLVDGEDPLAAAARWKESGLATVSLLLNDILTARMRACARGAAGTGSCTAAPMHFSHLLPLLDLCLEARSRVLARSNANEQLVLERIALSIAAVGAVRRAGDDRPPATTLRGW